MKQKPTGILKVLDTARYIFAKTDKCEVCGKEAAKEAFFSKGVCIECAENLVADFTTLIDAQEKEQDLCMEEWIEGEGQKEFSCRYEFGMEIPCTECIYAKPPGTMDPRKDPYAAGEDLHEGED